MSRQLITIVALLVAGGSYVSAQTTTDRNESRNPYTTIHTVIRVGADIDQYLDDEDKRFWSRPTEESLASITPATSPSSELDLSQIYVSGLDLRDTYLESDSALTSAIWFSRSELAERYDTSPVLISLGHLELGTAPELDPPTTPDVPEARQLATSPLDWEPSSESELDEFRYAEEQSIAAAPTIVAATVPSTTTAENAGLWFFLGIMIAPFAWLGWQEYQDLVNRSRRQSEASMDSEAREELEGELRELDIEVATPAEEEEEVVFTEIAATAEDDCEYELGVLDEANSLLATASHARRETEDAPRQESIDDAGDNETSASREPEDLTMLRGVGPATSAYLEKHGIRTLSDLEEAGAERIQEILDQAGSKFRTARPEHWFEQARDLLTTAR